MSASIRIRRSPLPEKLEQTESGFDRWLIGATAPVRNSLAMPHSRARRFVQAVLRRSDVYAAMTDEEIREAIPDVRSALLEQGEPSDGAFVNAFALIREICGRVKSVRHHPCQLLGGFVMLNGMLAEMATGEGKTVTAVLPAATMALRGTPVHVVTGNDYLAKRDAEEMTPLYEALGLKVGLITHGLTPAQKRIEYSRDVVYCSNKELAFDYLRDRIALRNQRTEALWRIDHALGAPASGEPPIMRGLHYAIVDEADSVLIDEARTPMIISSERPDENADLYRSAMEVARSLRAPEHYRLEEGMRGIVITSAGRARLAEHEACRSGILSITSAREEMIRQALVALHVFVRDHHYIVVEGKVQIVDEYTGRVMADRSWERGLHQFVEIKEGCEISKRRETVARMTYQRLFRRYLKLAGMSGTVREVSGELLSIYDLATIRIATHRPVKRRNLGTMLLSTEAEKLRRVVERAMEMAAQGRAVLIGTRSVAVSEEVSRLLAAEHAPHALLNARQDAEEAQAVSLAGLPGRITVATNMAGRGTDIKLAPETRAAGGLHVILTEFHESSRVDRQLFGRSGRQGDPGSCEAIVAVTDEIFTRFLPSWLRLGTVHPGLACSLAQGIAERRFRAERMVTFNQEHGQGERLAFAGVQE